MARVADWPVEGEAGAAGAVYLKAKCGSVLLAMKSGWALAMLPE